MEPDILPVSAGLVACPYGIITLRSCPSVKGDDIGTRILDIRNNVITLLHSAELEGISGSYPGNIGLERSHARFDFRLKVAEQMPVSVGIGVRLQVALCPEPCSNPFLCGIICKLFQVRHVCLDCGETRFGAAAVGSNSALHIITVLSVSRPISIVWQEETEGHVIVQIFIQNCTG